MSREIEHAELASCRIGRALLLCSILRQEWRIIVKKNLSFKNPLIISKSRLTLNLQRFAEGDGDGANAGSNDGGKPAGTDGQGNDDGHQDPPAAPAVAFKTQAEFDAAFSAKLAEARQQWEADKNQQKAYEDMSPEEKKDYDLKKAQSDLAAEQQKTLALTNKANLNARLAQDQLPGALIEVFGDVLTADDKTIDDTYTKLTTIFRGAVKTGIDAKLAQSAGAPGAGSAVGTKSAGQSIADARNKQPHAEHSAWATK
jgi:hypothetical protein